MSVFECEECRAVFTTWERADIHKGNFPGHKVTKCDEGPVHIPPVPAPPVPVPEGKS